MILWLHLQPLLLLQCAGGSSGWTLGKGSSLRGWSCEEQGAGLAIPMGLFQLEVFCDPVNSSQAGVGNDRLMLTYTIALKNSLVLHFCSASMSDGITSHCSCRALCGSSAVPCRHSEWDLCFSHPAGCFEFMVPLVFNWCRDPSWKSLLAVYSVFQKYSLLIHVRSS